MSIEDLFKNIICEAQNGNVDCYLSVFMLFETLLDGKYYKANPKYSNYQVPVLNIESSSMFYKYLNIYLDLAMQFYEDDKVILDLPSNDLKKKFLLTTLWSNATSYDFANPINYLEKRISFFKMPYPNYHDLGYSSILNSRIILEIKKEKTKNETPYGFETKLVDEATSEFYYLPTIRVGIHNGEAYIYSIQNTLENENNKYTKDIKRKLYKVNEGFNEQNELKDITPSFLLSLNILLSFLNSQNITKIHIPSLLLTRYNAHLLNYQVKANYLLQKGASKEEVQNYLKENYAKNDAIAKNISEKFIYTFIRLAHHHSGINVDNDTLSDDFIISITSPDYCNNPLLEETFIDNKFSRLK
jgi:hypothetical protein